MASDQQQLNMDQTHLSNPASMESSAAMASTSFFWVEMNNGSMPNLADQRPDYQSNPMLMLCGATTDSYPKNRSQSPSNDQIQVGDDSPFGSCDGVQQAGKSQLHSEERGQPLLTQEEHSEDSQQTKSRSGNKLSNEEKRKRKAESDRKYREKQKTMRQENKLLKMKVQQLEQSHHQSFSAPLASFSRDHRETKSGEMDQDHHHNGTNSVEVDLEEISYEDVRKLKKLKRRKQLWSTVHHLLRKGSTSRQQENEPLSEPARQSTIEQLHCSKDYYETETEAPDQFNGSRMSNDNQDPHRRASSSSGGVGSSAQITKNSENSQAGTMPMAELPKKNSMPIVTKDSLLVELMRSNSDPPPVLVPSMEVTPQAKRRRATISDCPPPRSSGASLGDKTCSKKDKGKEVDDGSIPSLLDSQGRLATYGRWKENVDSTEKGVTAIDLTLQLGLEDSGLEEGRVAYTLTKAMILPKDRDKFQTVQGDVSIAGRALVHEQYRTMMTTLGVVEKCDQLNCENSRLLEDNHSLTSQVDGFKRKLDDTLATCSHLRKSLDALKREKEESDGLVNELRTKVSFLESTMEDAKQVAITEYKASEAFISDVSAESLEAMSVGFDLLFHRVRLDYPDIGFPKYTLLQLAQDAKKRPDTSSVSGAT